MTNLLHYDFIAEFKKQYYKDLLLAEHLQGGQIKIDKLSFPDGSKSDEANFWGYVLVKDGKKYLLSAKGEDGKELNIAQVFPIKVKTEQKVAFQGDAYWWIRSWSAARLKAEQHMTYKELVHAMANLAHTHEEHKILWWFIGMTAMYSKINFRVCSPPGFGKDSVVDTLGNLIGGAGTIESPTLAKLEWETQKKWLVMNEAVGISSEKFREVELFLLAVGAHKPAVNKHSRAIGNGMKETLDISNFSLSIAYNDIDNYPNIDKYFDSATKKAVQDRFPAIRLWGTFAHDFNATLNESPAAFVAAHLNEYKKIIQTYTYYNKYFSAYCTRYTQPKLPSMPERWKTNIGRVLKVIDMYCDSQQEFDKWAKVLFAAMDDYKRMLEFPGLYREALCKITGVDPKGKEAIPETVGEFPEVRKLITELRKKNTFTEKNTLLMEFMSNTTQRMDTGLDTYIEDVI